MKPGWIMVTAGTKQLASFIAHVRHSLRLFSAKLLVLRRAALSPGLMLRQALLRGSRRSSAVPRRGYNFASTQYKECFGGLPIADGVKLRADTIAYLDSFDPQVHTTSPRWITV